MTKDERIDGFKYGVLQHAYKTRKLLTPVKHLTYPEPHIMSG